MEAAGSRIGTDVTKRATDFLNRAKSVQDGLTRSSRNRVKLASLQAQSTNTANQAQKKAESSSQEAADVVDSLTRPAVDMEQAISLIEELTMLVADLSTELAQAIDESDPAVTEPTGTEWTETTQSDRSDQIRNIAYTQLMRKLEDESGEPRAATSPTLFAESSSQEAVQRTDVDHRVDQLEAKLRELMADKLRSDVTADLLKQRVVQLEAQLAIASSTSSPNASVDKDGMVEVRQTGLLVNLY
eukprot:TRINITY_DN11857_c0_g2_i4.p1 TRINITY_DN11857_c0_g2~~TRINITY_DN11857_c0_g2_i4.p1  ORF type:complete len:244 (+),score=49.95 TRINITY_DN11857_c0_g2_i4:124-855(+)